jgi:hypothetical protein
MIAGCRRVNACRSNALQFFAKSRQQQCHRSAARLQRRPVACAEGAPTDSPVPSPSQAAEFAKHDELINRLLGCTNPQEVRDFPNRSRSKFLYNQAWSTSPPTMKPCMATQSPSLPPLQLAEHNKSRGTAELFFFHAFLLSSGKSKKLFCMWAVCRRSPISCRVCNGCTF